LRDDLLGNHRSKRGYHLSGHRFCSNVRLFLRDEAGVPFGQFDRLANHVASQGGNLVFAMNAGMYHPDRRPVGLFVAEGRQEAPVVTRAGPGNFGMLPNGVFCIGPEGFAVIDSRAYAAAPPACRYATQSGPLLVIDGALHPRFIPGSESRFLRNGVGVSADGQTAVFAISDRPVNFDGFARFFRDGLGLPQALYLDGRISRLHAPDLGRDDLGFPMGPIVGLLAPPGG
jgi:uncharacterized protein YigE (DUF2233 family)